MSGAAKCGECFKRALPEKRVLGDVQEPSGGEKKTSEKEKDVSFFACDLTIPEYLEELGLPLKFERHKRVWAQLSKLKSGLARMQMLNLGAAGDKIAAPLYKETEALLRKVHSQEMVGLLLAQDFAQIFPKVWDELLPGFSQSYLIGTKPLRPKWNPKTKELEDMYSGHNNLREIVLKTCGASLLCAQRLRQEKEHGLRVAFNYAGGLHHARSNKGHGFCAANDIAVAIQYWREQEPAARILYVDIDFHHGDGVEEIFYNDYHTFTFSTHASFTFPLTGAHADSWVNPTVKNYPFYYEEGLGPTEKKTLWTRVVALKKGWFQTVQTEIENWFKEHVFEYVVLQTGTDSVTGDEGSKKLTLNHTKPFFSPKEHKNLADLIALLCCQHDSQLLVLGGGGYDQEVAANQWSLECRSIHDIFASAPRLQSHGSAARKHRVPIKDQSHVNPFGQEEPRWEENPSNELINLFDEMYSLVYTDTGREPPLHVKEDDKSVKLFYDIFEYASFGGTCYQLHSPTKPGDQFILSSDDGLLREKFEVWRAFVKEKYEKEDNPEAFYAKKRAQRGKKKRQKQKSSGSLPMHMPRRSTRSTAGKSSVATSSVTKNPKKKYYANFANWKREALGEEGEVEHLWGEVKNWFDFYVGKIVEAYQMRMA